MKQTIFLVATVFTLFVLEGCTSPKANTTVGKNTSLEADFASIKSYSWTTDIDQIPKEHVFFGTNGIYVFNNESARKLIKDAIQYELDAKGYKMNRAASDMLVSFYVLEQGGTLRSTNGYVTVSSGEKVRTEDNVTWKEVKPGTLIINFIDADSKKVIWQGFASGILQPDQMRDQSKVRQAVSSIFSQFQHNNRASS